MTSFFLVLGRLAVVFLVVLAAGFAVFVVAEVVLAVDFTVLVAIIRLLS